MSDSNRTTPMPEAATPDTITITRPHDVKPAAWEYRATLAHLAMTGHFPWCSAHEDDPEGGWCVHAEHWFDIGEVIISNGTVDGSPHLQLSLEDDLNLDELTLSQASRLAGLIDHVANLGKFYNLALGAGK